MFIDILPFQNSKPCLHSPHHEICNVVMCILWAPANVEVRVLLFGTQKHGHDVGGAIQHPMDMIDMPLPRSSVSVSRKRASIRQLRAR